MGGWCTTRVARRRRRRACGPFWAMARRTIRRSSSSCSSWRKLTAVKRSVRCSFPLSTTVRLDLPGDGANLVWDIDRLDIVNVDIWQHYRLGVVRGVHGAVVHCSVRLYNAWTVLGRRWIIKFCAYVMWNSRAFTAVNPLNEKKISLHS